MGRVGLGSNSLLKPVGFYKQALHRQGRCSPPTPLLPLPPPAWLKSAAEVVRGDSGGIGPALAGSEAFRQGSDPAQTHPYGFSRSPKTARWVCLCPEVCVPNAGVTPRAALAPGLPSAILVPGETAVASAAQRCWWVKPPVFSGGCSKPSQPGGCSGGVRCPHPPFGAPRPTHCVGRWAVESCVPSLPLLQPSLPICIHRHPFAGAWGCVFIPVFPWVCDLERLRRSRPPALLEPFSLPGCPGAGTEGRAEKQSRAVSSGGEKAC